MEKPAFFPHSVINSILNKGNTSVETCEAVIPVNHVTVCAFVCLFVQQDDERIIQEIQKEGEAELNKKSAGRYRVSQTFNYSVPLIIFEFYLA